MCEGSGPISPEFAETHSALLVFIGDRVFKIKKPVDFGFLDFSTPESRSRACRRELELNRRLAPDVYFGTADVAGEDGVVCDTMLVMRRLPTERRLRELLAGGQDVTGALHAVARQVVMLHERSVPDPTMELVGRRDVVRQRWIDGFAQMEALPVGLIEPSVQERIERLAIEFLEGREPLFELRRAQGHIRDGHGDLMAEDIFVLDDGPRIIDCLDFNDELRWGDVLLDVAFLAMDLERLGHPAAAAVFLDHYRELSADSWSLSLLHHYIAYRAHVRAKVSALRAAQDRSTADDTVERLQALCLKHLEAGRVRLIVVGGAPGTGKSTVAADIGQRLGAVVLRTDEIRSDDSSVAVDGTTGVDRYSDTNVDLTYERMIERANVLLRRGESVVLDATWASERHRRLARSVATSAVTPLVELRCVAPDAECDRRIVARLAAGVDPSEATVAVARAMRGRFEAWPTSVSIDTGRSIAEAVKSANSTIELQR